MAEDIRRRGIRVAMLAVPAPSAQAAADELVQAGVQAILCYAPTTVSVPENVLVRYIDPVVGMQHMTHYLP
jgi:redox-sensing transcriptional repressor